MVCSGIYLQNLPAGLEHPGEFAINRKPKQAKHQIQGFRQNRQICIAANHPAGVFVLFGRCQNRPFRDIDTDHGKVFVAGMACKVSKVKALSGTCVQNRTSPLSRQRLQRLFANRFCNLCIEPGIQKPLPGRDHFLAVTGVQSTLFLNR